MAFKQYPNSIFVLVQTAPDSGIGSTINLGQVTPFENHQLAAYRIQIFKYGMQPNVRMKLRAYHGSTIIGESAIVRVSDIELKYPSTPYFYGWIIFNFEPRLNFLNSTATSFVLILENYVFAEGVSWIGAVFDWPITMGFNENPVRIDEAPFAIELYGAE